MEIPQELIDNCAREPIHIPGAIQPSGLLFGLAGDELVIARVSDNVADELATPAAQLLGKRLADVLGADVAEAVARLAPSLISPAPAIPLYSVVTTPRGVQSYDGLLHRSGELLVLELLAAPPDAATSSERLHRFSRLMTRLGGATSLKTLSKMAAEEVQAISGFDHVMVYRFSPDWNGEVIAEARAKDSPSYMGHWFPASDIPAQARDLYTRNWLRLIPSVPYTPVPISSLPDAGGSAPEPLDLSYSALRSVSPVHVEYLKNMGVSASMSISLLRGGELWGLIACHNPEPVLLPLQARLNCEMLGQFLSMKIASLEREDEYHYSEQLRAFRTRLLGYLSQEERYTEGLIKYDPNLTHIVNSEGAAICSDETTLVGKTPTVAQCNRISDWLTKNASEDTIFFTSSLPRLFAEAAEYANVASGLIAIPFDASHSCWVLWFRPEVIETVRWAGNPEKAIEARNGGPPTLHPRRSFASWAETVRMRAHPWRSAEIEAALDLRATLSGLELAASYEREHRIAETLQRSLLSAPPRQAFNGLDIEIAYRAAMREAEVGGDYYDVFSLPDAESGGRIALVVGDVSGKGLAAASRTAEIKYTLRTYLRDNPDPAAALQRLNTFLHSQQALDEANTGAAGGVIVPFTFVCIAIAVVETATGLARIASGGTEPPLLLRGGGAVEEINAQGMPLGVSSEAEFTAVATTLSPDDLLLLVTDGITEARRGEEFLGYDGFIRLTREALPLGELRRIGDTILNGAALYSGGSLRDDACLLMARRSG